MQLRLGLLLALAMFFLVSSLLCLALAGSVRRLAGTAYRNRPAVRARLLLGLRLLPTSLSAVLVFGSFVPSFLLFEPADRAERAGWLLTALAVGSLSLCGLALGRAAVSTWASARLARQWLLHAQPLPTELPARTFRIRDRFPVVCVVGNARPLVFVADQVLEALSPSELSAALTHESAHIASKDNLKRFVFRCCPDILGLLPAGSWLRHEWEQSCEAAADAAAASGDLRRALDLSAALLKVARLAPPGARIAWPTGALHSGEGIEHRIRQLVGSVPTETMPLPWRVSAIAGACALLLLLVTQPAVLQKVNDLTELCVRLLR